MNGIAREIVERAEEFLVLTARGEDLIAACTIMPESEAVELKQAVCLFNFASLKWAHQLIE
jgi:DNA mismatch repair protein MSH5